MIVSNPNLGCEQALPCYYDYISEDDREHVSVEVLKHIERCQHCQSRIEKLKNELQKTENADPVQNQIWSNLDKSLDLQFAFIEKQVTCNVVKPFLPGLAGANLDITVPTPITVHIDNCPACSDDFAAIKQLRLAPKQLHRLTKLFLEKPPQPSEECEEALKAIAPVAAMNFQETNAEVLKHLCICPDCRKILGLLYESQQAIQAASAEDQIASKFPCEEVLPVDIFDYVIPYGIDPAADEKAKFREPLISHLRDCPECLDNMLKLHTTICTMIEREESDIITYFQIGESARDISLTELEKSYSDYFVKVKVIDKSEDIGKESVEQTPPNNGFSFEQESSRKVPALTLKRIVRPVAAAVILIAISAMFFMTPAAQAVDLNRIYKALEKIKNVYVAKFSPGKLEPTEKKWISRSSNEYIDKTENRLALWDLSKGTGKRKDLNTSQIDEIRLSKKELTSIEKLMEGSLGLLPFDDMSEVPEDAKWQQVVDTQTEGVTDSTEIYELEWKEKGYDGGVIYKKWRGYINTDTCLPEKVERYTKLYPNGDYELDTYSMIKYLTEEQYRQAIKEGSF